MEGAKTVCIEKPQRSSKKQEYTIVLTFQSIWNYKSVVTNMLLILVLIFCIYFRQGMGKSYMESVILDEVRKLSKVLGFKSIKDKSSNSMETRSLSVHQNGIHLSNIVRDSFSECQKITLENSKVEDVSESLSLRRKHLSNESNVMDGKKER